MRHALLPVWAVLVLVGVAAVVAGLVLSLLPALCDVAYDLTARATRRLARAIWRTLPPSPGARAAGPPMHPNCRCAAVPDDERPTLH